jgi:DNA-binding transcriptional regulator YiaG
MTAGWVPGHRRPAFTPHLIPLGVDAPRIDATAEEFNRLLDELGLGQMAAARLLGVNGRTVRRWAAGKANVLPSAARFLRFLVKAKISPITVMETLVS